MANPNPDGGSPRALWLASPTALLYAATFLFPFGFLLVTSFFKFDSGVTTPGFYLDNYKKLFTDGVTLPVFWDTVVLALYITAVSILIAYPVGMLMRNVGPKTRVLLIYMLVSPLLTSIIVRNLAWLLILGREGMVNRWLMEWGVTSSPLPLMYNELGVIIAVVHVYLPFAVLPILGSLSAIDRRTEAAASSLGAGPLRVFWNVTLPLSMPGVAAAATLVFILSMGLYLTPVIMGGNFVVTLSMLITSAARDQYNWPVAAAMSVLLLVSIMVAVLVPSLLSRLLKRA